MQPTQSSKSSMGRGLRSNRRCSANDAYSTKRSSSMMVATTTYGSTIPVWRRVLYGTYGRRALLRRRKSAQQTGYEKCTRGRLLKCRREARSDIGGGTFSSGFSMRSSRRPRPRYVPVTQPAPHRLMDLVNRITNERGKSMKRRVGSYLTSSSRLQSFG